MTETIVIKDGGPLVLTQLPEVQLPLGDSGASMTARIVSLEARSRRPMFDNLYYVLVEAHVRSAVSVPLAMIQGAPEVPPRVFRFALSFAEACHVGLFGDKVEVVSS